MSDKSDLTCKELLEALFEKIRSHAAEPEIFASEWERIADELDSEVKELEQIMLERDKRVRELLILMRKQLVKRTDQSTVKSTDQRTPFDDWDLQASQGCTLLKDYAGLNPRPSNFGGHKCDGINWDMNGRDGKKDGDKLPTNPPEPLNFHGGTKTGWLYCGSLDHAISNLICKVWGFSGFTDSEFGKPKKDMLPSISFDTGWWKDASMYLAVLLCFGDNILDDHIFLDKIGVTFNEPVTSQDRLQTVLSAKEANDIRKALWERIQELIRTEDDA